MLSWLVGCLTARRHRKANCGGGKPAQSSYNMDGQRVTMLITLRYTITMQHMLRNQSRVAPPLNLYMTAYQMAPWFLVSSTKCRPAHLPKWLTPSSEIFARRSQASDPDRDSAPERAATEATTTAAGRLFPETQKFRNPIPVPVCIGIRSRRVWTA